MSANTRPRAIGATLLMTLALCACGSKVSAENYDKIVKGEVGEFLRQGRRDERRRPRVGTAVRARAVRNRSVPDCARSSGAAAPAGGVGGLLRAVDRRADLLQDLAGRIADAGRLAKRLSSIPGVVEHGLFIGFADVVILAGAAGIRVVQRS